MRSNSPVSPDQRPSLSVPYPNVYALFQNQQSIVMIPFNLQCADHNQHHLHCPVPQRKYSSELVKPTSITALLLLLSTPSRTPSFVAIAPSNLIPYPAQSHFRFWQVPQLHREWCSTLLFADLPEHHVLVQGSKQAQSPRHPLSAHGPPEKIKHLMLSDTLYTLSSLLHGLCRNTCSTDGNRLWELLPMLQLSWHT